jgi:hypothetical protein
MRIFSYPRDPMLPELERRVALTAHEAYLAGLTRQMARHACSDPVEADFFFVPLNLITFQFANVVAQAGTPLPDPYEIIGRLPHLDRGRHLIVSTGDFGQRRRSPYEFAGPGRAYPELYPWLDERFHLLAFESTPDLWAGDLGLLPWVQQPREPRWQRRWSRPRDLRFSFAGAIAYPQLPPQHIRGGRLRSIAGAGDDHFIGTAAEARERFGWGGTDRNILRRSIFAICPGGFGRWTFRLAQAVYYGAIPVVVSDSYVKPHGNRLAWERFSLTVPEDELETIPDRLRGMGEGEIKSLQQGLAEHRESMLEAGALALLDGDLADLAAVPG